MDRRRAAGVLLALAACVAYATAAPTASNHTSLDLYDGAPDGCYYNFQHYGEGDRIMTNEPCLNCTCHNRMLMCYLRVCPFTKPIGQDCTIEKRADQCCPIVTCPDVPVDLLTSTTTSPAEYGATGLGKLDKFGCSIHGKYFPEGSKVPPTPNKPCEHCYCIRNMTTCVMQECTLHVDGCTPIYHKDVCCPVRYSCDHPEDEMPLLDDLSTTVRPTPGFLLTTTTLSPVTQMSQDCLYENQIIPDGALIKTEKACDHCYCMKGDIVCVVQECGTPMENEGKNCTALSPREGVCCPDTYICEGDEPTTSIYDITTEADQEKLTLITPPRRSGSEGSGYRNEPDDIPNTPNTESLPTETEGSGDDQEIIYSTVLPETRKNESSEVTLPSTEEPNEFITIASTKEPASEYSSVSDEHKDITEQYIPSTSSYISQEIEESSTAKGLDEDIGSGEEDFITPHEVNTSSSRLPSIEENEPTVANEQNIVTTESHKETSKTYIEESTTSQPMAEDKENTYLPNVVTEKNEMEVTTSRRHLDEEESLTTSINDNESLQTENNLIQSTSSIPYIEENERKTTESGGNEEITYKTDAPSETETKSSLDLDYSTSALGIEAEISTESQVTEIEGIESTSTDIDTHHITMTTSTPLLEEIEKEPTEEMYNPDAGVPEKPLPSITVPDISAEESTGDKDSLKPDLIDETISTNIPTTVADLESDEIASTEPEIENVEMSSESQQYSPTTSAPVSEDDHKKITKSDDKPTIENEMDQAVEYSSESQYSPTTSASVSDSDREKTTKSDYSTTTESERDQDVEISSETEKYLPTSASEDDIEKTTQLDYVTTTQHKTIEHVMVTTEPQKYHSTTSTPIIEDDTKRITESHSVITDEPGISENILVYTESETQSPTTLVFEEDIKKTTPADSIVTIGLNSDTDVTENLESQQDSLTTSASPLEEEIKKFTPSGNTVTETINIQQFVSDSMSTLQESDYTTDEPDKGLNTIPSGLAEEEITKPPVSGTETENKYSDEIESATDITKYTTLVSDTSASREDQSMLTTEPAIHEMIDSNTPDIVQKISEQTTEAIDVTDKITHSQSLHTVSPSLEQVTDTSIPLTTENLEEADANKPSPTSSYEYSTQATGSEDDSIIDKHETSAPSTDINSGSTTASLEENEIMNEPRIPGEGDCLLNGVTYRNESVVPSSNKCQSGCKCISSIIKCDPIICSPPPEYMDNCQTTYDSPDSCCPTYICDHKTETMPPQSHSQMTGTEEETPIKCDGDVCVPSVYPSEAPKQPITDSQEKCSGDKCITTDKVCNEEGCQATPVIPCEGNECEDTSDNIPPQKQQPCANSEDCDVPAKECSNGKCESDEDTSQKQPHDRLDIEKECTEKSCKRKDDSGQVQHVPQMCSGDDCQSNSDQETATTVPITSNEEEEMSINTEKSTEITTIDENRTMKPNEVTTAEPEQHETDINFKPQSELVTTQEISSTYLPDLDKNEKEGITDSPVLQESTYSVDEKLETDLPETYITVESVTNIEPVASVTTEMSDHLFDITVSLETTSKTQEITKSTQEKSSTESTTVVIENETTPFKMAEIETQTKPTEKEVFDDMKTSALQEISTEPSIGYTESLDIPTEPTYIKEPADTTTVEADNMLTVSEAHDTESQKVTKSPTFSKTEETTKLTNDITTKHGMEYETTTFLDISGDEKITTPRDIYDSDIHEPTTSKINEVDKITSQIPDKESSAPQEGDGQATTQSSLESEESTIQSEDKIVSKPENDNILDVTKIPEDISEEIATDSLSSQSTESPQAIESDVTETTKLPLVEKETTIVSEDLSTETLKPSDFVVPEATKYPKDTESAETSTTEVPPLVSDDTLITYSPEKQDIPQSSDITKVESTSQVTEPASNEPYDKNTPEYTISPEVTESEEVTSKPLDKTTTEPSVVHTGEQIYTKSEENVDFAITEEIPITESSNLDGISSVTVTQRASTYETSTKLTNLDEVESVSTVVPTEEITNQIMTNETDKMPSDLEIYGTTESSSEKSDSEQKLEITTPKYTDEQHKLDSESHSLGKITTAVPDTVPEITTLYISETDSKTTKSKVNANELTTEMLEQSQTTEATIDLVTESVIKSTTAFSDSPDVTNEDITSHIENVYIPTKAPVDIVREPEINLEMTISPYAPKDDDLSTTETNIITSDKTILDQSKPEIQDSGAPDMETETTTVDSIDLDEKISKPTPTSVSEDDKLEDTPINTEVPVLREKDDKTTSETSSLQAIDTTEVPVDMKTEQKPELAEPPKKEQSEESLDIETTGTPSALEVITTAQPIVETETKLPVDSEIIATSHSDETGVSEPSPTEPFKMDKDELETESPAFTSEYALEISTTEKPVDNVTATEIRDQSDEHPTPSESDDDSHSKTPSFISSTTLRHEYDDEYTTPSTKTTESNISVEPTEPSYDMHTEESPETTQKNLELEVTENIVTVSDNRRNGAGDKVTETMVSVTSVDQESSTQQQPSIDSHKLSTEPQFIEDSGTEITTQIPIDLEPFKNQEEHIVKDTETIAPEKEDSPPTQHTTTESAEPITKAQDKEETSTTISDISATSPLVVTTTEVQEAAQISTKFPEVTSPPVQDTEKSSENEYTSTPKIEFIENTTVTEIQDESDKDIKIPSTETQPAPIDVITQKIETTTESFEEEFISKVTKPEASQTTASPDSETEVDLSTSSPIFAEEASTSPGQILTTSIEPHLSEEQKPTNAIINEMDGGSTSKVPGSETQTTEFVTLTEKPIQTETSPEKSKPEKEISTTLKPTTVIADEIFTSGPIVDKFTMPPQKPTETVATEQPRPIPTEDQHTDDILTPDEEASIPSSGTSGYGQEPDYMEEDQTFGPGTCRYGGKVYVSAQQIPRDDPCDFCFCFRSDIICLQQSCPPPIHGCHEEPIQGFCCPRYECPVSMATTVNVTTTTTTTTTTLPPHFPVHSYKGSAQKRGCLIKGHSYKVGEVVRASSGPCLHCTCGGDGQMKCDPKQCTPEPMLRQMIAAAVSAKRRR